MRISDQAYNRHKVLKAIRRYAPVARTELTAHTGLAGATITQVTGELLRRGLLREARAPASGRGRPRTTLTIDPAGGLVVGAAVLTDGRLSTSLADLAGNEVFASTDEINTPRCLADVARTLARIIAGVIVRSGVDRTSIRHVALVIPAVIDAETGTVHWFTTFDEPPCPFAAIMSEQLGVPVTIENDSTCLARAEHWFGAASSCDDFSLFRVSVWLGSAQYRDGLPQVGANGFNSEAGHVKADFGPDARPCLCGARGCLGMYASMLGVVLGSGRLSKISTAPQTELLPLYREIVQSARGGDVAALEPFEAAGHHLGIAIANHVNSFDPGNVLILFEDENLREFVAEALQSSLRQNTFAPLYERTEISFGVPVPDWRCKGAAAQALEQIYLGNGQANQVTRLDDRSATHAARDGPHALDQVGVGG